MSPDNDHKQADDEHRPSQNDPVIVTAKPRPAAGAPNGGTTTPPSRASEKGSQLKRERP